MLTYNPTTDIMADVPVEQPLSLDCIHKMMHSCVWAEKMYLELGMYEQASRYARIWGRLFKASADRMLKRKN